MTRSDWLALSLAVGLLPLLYVHYWDNAPASQARIMVAGQEALTVPLAQQREITVDGPLGPTTIKVRNGQVRVSASPCQGKQCIHAGWLSHGGESTACLPNQVSVMVASRDPRFDAVNF